MSSSASAPSTSSLGKRPAADDDQQLFEEDVQRNYEQEIKALNEAFERDEETLVEQHKGEEAAKRQEYEHSLSSLTILERAASSPAEREKLQQARNSAQEALDHCLEVLNGAYRQKIHEEEIECRRKEAEKEKWREEAMEAIRSFYTAITTRRPRLDDEEQAATNMGEEEEGQQQLQENGETEEEEERRRRRHAQGHALVNKRIRVYAAVNHTFYSGVVTGFSDTTGEHTVRYDDYGYIDTLDLSTDTITWMYENDEEEEDEEEEQQQQQQPPQQQEAQGHVAAVSLAEALGQGRKLPAMVLEHHMLPCLNDRDRFSLARASKTLQAAVSSPAAWTGTRRLDVTCSSGYTCRDTISQRGRRSHPVVASDMIKGLCRYLALPQFSQVEALYLRVKIVDVNIFTATILERFPRIKTLLLDGGGCQIAESHPKAIRFEHIGWCVPQVFDMIESLETLRELQFPLIYTSEPRALFSHIPHVHTLHYVNRDSFTQADVLNAYFPKRCLESIHVLTLVAFFRVKYSTIKCILSAFPELKMLSLRLSYLNDDPVRLRERIVTDFAFAGRADGWFDRIVFDFDKSRATLRPSHAGWFRQDLFAYDDMTGGFKESVGDLTKTYDSLMTSSIFRDSLLLMPA